MKNFKLQPFERNNYFYGKLMTVRDFQIEQKYNNEKRWMMNRLMFGNGIASGLNVVMIDEQTIAVEPGIAIDNLGREIVLSSPITQKLSLIDGFDNSGYSKSIYLCVDYDEKGKERIQTITNSIDDNSEDALSYNRIQENYKMYLKENVSSDDVLKNSSSYLSKTCIYENNKIQIYQTTPKFIEPDEEFDIVIDVIKKDPSCSIDFMYTINSENVFSTENMGKSNVVVQFSEPKKDVKSNYSLKYRMLADSRIEKNASMHITIDHIKVNDQNITQINEIFIEFDIVDDKIDALFNNYSNRSVESIINDESYETIYLAEISLLKVGSIYLIKSITNCPFNQYVYNNSIVKDLLQLRLNNKNNNLLNLEDNSKDIQQLQNIYQKNQASLNTQMTGQENQDVAEANQNQQSNIYTPDISMTEGEYIFKIDDKMKYPGIIYSEEISHGLGFGDVMINASVYDEENFEDVIFNGDVDILDKCPCKIATTLNPKKGMFTITIKVMGNFRYSQVRVKWFAIKNNK